MFWKTEVPVPDERMLKTIEKLQLNEKDLRTFYKKFSASDKEVRQPTCHNPVGSGSIDRDEFFHSFREERTAVGDAVFALIDIDNSGELDFSEYVEALGAFCLLNTDDVLKFCFFVFDQDKNGTIEGSELDMLLEMLHQDDATSNMAAAMDKFDFNGDGKMDFREFQLLNQQFPALLYPVYRLQLAMKTYSMGETWWNKRAELLAHLKETKQNASETQAALAKAKEQQRQAKQAMGCLKYYLCPCRRSAYIVNDTGLTEEDLIEQAKQQELEAQKKKLEAAMAARAKMEKKAHQVVAVDGRKVMSKAERKERARKRRMRDMKDLPSRRV